MEFLKALHEAERYGVTRDAFMAIWQREAELNQKREDARILDLKQSLAMAEHQVRHRELLLLDTSHFTS